MAYATQNVFPVQLGLAEARGLYAQRFPKGQLGSGWHCLPGKFLRTNGSRIPTVSARVPPHPFPHTCTWTVVEDYRVPAPSLFRDPVLLARGFSSGREHDL